MKNYIKLAFAVIICISGCEKYLDEKPDKKLVVLSTVHDAQALLDNVQEINMAGPLSIHVAADEHYLTTTDWLTANNTDRYSYIWGDDIFNDNRYNDWSLQYRIVYYCNIILDALDEGKIKGSQKQLDDIKGQSLFIRSFAFYNLLQVFAKSYLNETGGREPGIPLRLVSDHNAPTIRSDLKTSYDRVINDLQQAVKLLPMRTGVLTRGSGLGANALLARVYLSMENYEDAFIYANNALTTYNSLLDYNLIVPSGSFSFQRFNDEVLFHANVGARAIMTPPYSKIDSVLFKNYESNDLRKDLYFQKNNDNSYSFKGSYNGSVAFFTGLATDELYLIRAECYAKKGKVEVAMEDLNHLLMNRIRKSAFVPLTASNSKDALDMILSERKKQLLFRGTRWSDLRRLNNDPDRRVTIKRVINGKEYELLPNDSRYVFPIPLNVIQMSGIKQNER